MAGKALVIDASVAVKASLVQDGFAVLAGRELHAPTLLWSEAGSALAQLRRRGEISDQEARQAFQRLLAASLTVHASSELVSDALELARTLGWARTYDAEYVVLARSLNAGLLTLDARLASGISHLVEVVAAR